MTAGRQYVYGSVVGTFGGDAAQVTDGITLASVAVSDMTFYQRALNYQACDPECSVARRERNLPQCTLYDLSPPFREAAEARFDCPQQADFGKRVASSSLPPLKPWRDEMRS
jgi:hypothetical protein